MERPPSQPILVEDLHLEIVARTNDAATVVRYAATSKPLRRAIRDAAFRRRLAAAKGGGFNPALLADVSYRIKEYGNGTILSPSQRVQFERRLLNSFVPACSRDGVLVLWRNRKLERSFNEHSIELRVCNVFTGHHASLPRMKLINRISRGISGGIYRPALLTMGEGVGGHSFKLLIMNKWLQIETFSAQDGKWGDVHPVHSPPIIARHISHDKVCHALAAVIGSTVHWLCHLTRNPHDLCMIILAVDADTAQATAIQLPEEYFTSLGSWNTSGGDPAEGRLMLAATRDGTTMKRLSLLVAEPTVISMWTLIKTPDEGDVEGSSSRWSRQTVMRRREIERQLGSGLDTYRAMQFKGFGEGSGTVLLWIERVGLVQLSLVTKKAVLLHGCRERGDDVRACLHEVNMASLLCGMKPF